MYVCVIVCVCVWKFSYVIGAQGSIASSRTLVPACGQVLRIRRHEERVARLMSKYYGYEDMRIVSGVFPQSWLTTLDSSDRRPRPRPPTPEWHPGGSAGAGPRRPRAAFGRHLNAGSGAPARAGLAGASPLA